MMRCVFTALVLTLTGCLSSHTERIGDVSPLSWTPDAAISVIYNNKDTTGVRKISFLLRWDDTFEHTELPCTITTIAPDSTIFHENIDFEIGRGIISKHSTGYRDSQIGYRDDVVLSQSGAYKFVIQPTDPEPIVGVWAVGLKISE